MSREDEHSEAPDAVPGQQHGHGTNSQDEVSSGSGHKQQEDAAAQMIQRNYRGYRERRQLAGMGLDANARWSEV
jgi:hypothetical protein